MASVKNAVVVIIAGFLASCNLVSQTQVGFWNQTSSYTLLEVKIGSVDYTTTLSPGSSPTAYFPMGEGSYTLYTRGTNDILYQWPTKQQFARGFGYILIFTTDASNNLQYSVYVSIAQ